MKNLVLEFDDFHWRSPENCIHEVDELIKEFPDIKISLFTTPLLNNLPLYENKDWINQVRSYIKSNNLRLAVHGLYHTQEEFKFLDKSQATQSLLLAQSIFVQSDLPFTKVFRGPHWGINEQSIQALNDLGYTHFYNHENYRHLDGVFNNKVIYYNWNLKDEAPVETLLVAHGHTHNVCQNGINETMHRIKKFIREQKPKFLFVDEI